MKTGLFIAEIEAKSTLRIPQEISERINLAEGDKVEILLKKIRSRKWVSARCLESIRNSYSLLL